MSAVEFFSRIQSDEKFRNEFFSKPNEILEKNNLTLESEISIIDKVFSEQVTKALACKACKNG